MHLMQMGIKKKDEDPTTLHGQNPILDGLGRVVYFIINALSKGKQISRPPACC